MKVPAVGRRAPAGVRVGEQHAADHELLVLADELELAAQHALDVGRVETLAAHRTRQRDSAVADLRSHVRAHAARADPVPAAERLEERARRLLHQTQWTLDQPAAAVADSNARRTRTRRRGARRGSAGGGGGRRRRRCRRALRAGHGAHCTKRLAARRHQHHNGTERRRRLRVRSLLAARNTRSALGFERLLLLLRAGGARAYNRIRTGRQLQPLVVRAATGGRRRRRRVGTR